MQIFPKKHYHITWEVSSYDKIIKNDLEVFTPLFHTLNIKNINNKISNIVKTNFPNFDIKNKTITGIYKIGLGYLTKRNKYDI